MSSTSADLACSPPAVSSRSIDIKLELLSSGVIDYGLCKLPEIAKLGHHACRVNSYIMLYYFEDDAVVIAHVFHQRQDYARLV